METTTRRLAVLSCGRPLRWRSPRARRRWGYDKAAFRVGGDADFAIVDLEHETSTRRPG